MFLQLLVLSHLHTVTQNPKVYCILVVQCTFFQTIPGHCLLFDKIFRYLILFHVLKGCFLFLND